MAERADPLDERELWTRFRATGDPAIRNQLVLQNMHLVRWAVDRVAYAGSNMVDREDLISEGLVGLIDAIDRYDPERGILLSTYAAFRIRGQIADALRARDALPRSARQRVRELQETVTRLTSELGRPPSEGEIAQTMHIDEGELRQTLVDASFEVSSLDAPRSGDEEDYSLLATLQAPAQTEPGSHHDDEELVRELGRALGRLPERQRLLLSLYYVEELTMKEVGEVLGISESRVSQLHGQAVTALRGLLQAAGYLKREPGDPGSTPSPDRRGPATRSPAPHAEHRPAPVYEAMVSVSERRYGRHMWEV